jgi:electron transfer flavoprotein beta subunit
VKILVCVKQVPDMEARFVPRGDGLWYDEEDLAFKVNEYDEYAVEAAVRLKEREGADTELTALTVGPPRAAEALKKALAMGCDQAVRIADEAPHEKDPHQIASLIHAWAQGQAFDFVFTGIQSQDRGSAQVGPLLAAALDAGVVTGVSRFAYGDGRATALVDLEGGTVHTVRIAPPAVITFQTGPESPRYPTVPSIMRAKQKAIAVVEASSLAQVAPLLETVGVRAPEKSGAAVFLEGDATESADRLVEILRARTTVLARAGGSR